MMFNEWVKDKTSLFTEINNITPIPFINTYGAEQIDLIYKVKYGRKPIPKSIEHLNIKELANIISMMYSENWKRKYTLMKDEILLGVESRVELTETINDDIMKVSNSSKENKVSAFNDDELVTNDSDSNTLNDDTKKEYNRNTVTTNTNFKTIKSQLELFNHNFINMVCEDVSKIVSLSIY